MHSTVVRVLMQNVIIFVASVLLTFSLDDCQFERLQFQEYKVYSQNGEDGLVLSSI